MLGQSISYIVAHPRFCVFPCVQLLLARPVCCGLLHPAGWLILRVGSSCGVVHPAGWLILRVGLSCGSWVGSRPVGRIVVKVQRHTTRLESNVVEVQRHTKRHHSLGFRV